MVRQLLRYYRIIENFDSNLVSLFVYKFEKLLIILLDLYQLDFIL